MGKIKINHGAVLTAAAMVLFFDVWGTVQILLAVLLHEWGHISALCLCGGKVTKISVAALGVEINQGRELSYWKDAVIALSGPIANLLSVIALRYTSIPGLYIFAGASVTGAVFNLLPVSILDGGRALGAIMAQLFGPVFSWYVSKALDVLIIGIIFSLGVLTLVKYRNPMAALSGVYMYNLCCKKSASGVKFTG